MIGLSAQVAGLEAALERLAPEPKINREDRSALDATSAAAGGALWFGGFHGRRSAGGPRAARGVPTAHAEEEGTGEVARDATSIASAVSPSSGRRLVLVGEEGHANLWQVVSVGLSGLTDPFKAA